ncbi:hypothetical protein A2Y99_04980 [Candidatus Gottesmanbacteria bacterium RBG_13_37_7]|uniref:Uncharacterized protein n=1 Tax=Candidatus Gottesmanbacteria bacterium RBG_13_37_7 TaxID=1798369 RepID=A0A1F5YG61_9BACT|nr:MAG: hypothetical protein A2Y99_04980 [Candidatus Gottesmanbacteria bacterium RBG_13_37_7]
MIVWVSIAVIFIFSFVLAIKASEKELLPPEEIRSIHITKKKKISGVILFLKQKIIHYSSDSS